MSFPIFSKENDRVTTYNYWIDNLSSEFKTLKFKNIEDTISFEKYKTIKTKTLKDLSKLSACDLLFLLADTRNIYMLKKQNNMYYKYRLVYSSTQRGIEYAVTH